MVTSLEMRWFYRGTPTTEVEQWFYEDFPGEPPLTPDNREDVYLITTPMSEYLNIKLREGRLEVKWRSWELGVLSFDSRYAGNVENWVKWMCEDPSVNSITLERVVGEKQWLAIAKSRYQRLYKIPNSKSLTLVPITQPKEASCAVELTKLNIRGNNWWSLAFEAFGEQATLRDTLQPAAELVFKTYRGPQLQPQDSFAYPKWISIFL